MRYLYLLTLTLFLFSCNFGAPVLDGSDKQSVDASYDKIIEWLPSREREKTFIEFSRIQNAYMGHIAFRYEGENREMRERRWLNAVAGMNVEQISAEALRIQQAWVLGDLLGARADYENYQAAVSLLSKVKLLEYRFVPVENSVDQAELEAVILNGSSITFFAVAFNVDLLFRDGEFDRKYQIYFYMPEGISPGQEKVVNAFSTVRLTGDGEPFNQIKNFDATILFDLPEGKIEQKIVNKSHQQSTTLEELQKAEEKYQLLYGDNKPKEWSANISRELSKQNIYSNLSQRKK